MTPCKRPTPGLPLSAPLTPSGAANITPLHTRVHERHGAHDARLASQEDVVSVQRYGRPMISATAEPFVFSSRLRFFSSARISSSLLIFSSRRASINVCTCSFSETPRRLSLRRELDGAEHGGRNGCGFDSSTPRAISTSREGSTMMAQFPAHRSLTLPRTPWSSTP